MASTPADPSPEPDTPLAGLCLAQADHRPAHLTRVHQALTSLPVDEQRRLGVITDWKHGPHRLTCRQAERTFGLVADALARDEPGGLRARPGTKARVRLAGPCNQGAREVQRESSLASVWPFSCLVSCLVGRHAPAGSRGVP